MAAIFSMGRWVNITIQWRQDMPLGWSLDSLLMLTSNETSKGNTGGYLSVTQSNDFYSWVNKSCVDKFVQWYNNGSNGHLFYVGVDLMMRRSMLPIHDDVIKWKHFPRYWPFVRGFDVFFDLRPDKRLSKQSRGWWFETPSHSLWRHRNVLCFPMGICVLRCTECRSEFWLFGGLFTFYVRFTKPNVAHNRNR